MRKHRKTWIALAGATTVSAAGLLAAAGPAAAVADGAPAAEAAAGPVGASGTGASEATGSGANAGGTAAGAFAPGTPLMGVRTCLAAELLPEGAPAQPGEVAEDDARLVGLWRSVGSDTRGEAARTCAVRFGTESSRVKAMMEQLAAGVGDTADTTDSGGAGGADGTGGLQEDGAR